MLGQRKSFAVGGNQDAARRVVGGGGHRNDQQGVVPGLQQLGTGPSQAGVGPRRVGLAEHEQGRAVPGGQVLRHDGQQVGGYFHRGLGGQLFGHAVQGRRGIGFAVQLLLAEAFGHVAVGVKQGGPLHVQEHQLPVQG